MDTSLVETSESLHADTVLYRSKGWIGSPAIFPLVVLMLSLLCLPTYAQTNEWAWMGGSNVNDESPVYGTLGTPAMGNIPGSRYLAASWTDTSGNMWLFGGGLGSFGSNQSVFGDLWEFNPSTNVWAWVGGSNSANQPGVYGTQGKASSGNRPGARDAAASWIDSAGQFWLFGGEGFDAAGNPGLLNDLWKFDPSTMQWTWVSGSSTIAAFGGQIGVYGTLGTPAAENTPGGRESPTVWLDKSGNVWLFGGYVIIELPDGTGDEAGFNDLWEFNPSTAEWSWMGGSNTPCDYGVQSGVWGTMGTPAAGNIPSCRFAANGWTDRSGNFWLFGSEGRDIEGYWGDLNNVWEFNPSTQQWAWMGGTDIIDLPGGVPPGSYGVLGVPAAGNIPAGRRNAATWTDLSGNFWLLGGIATGFEGDSGITMLNDLWEFSPVANEWSWMGGSSSLGGAETGVYGTQGLAATANTPGDRWGGAGWTDRSGNFWLFGGEGYPNSLLICDLSEMWKYAPLAPTPVPGFSLVDLNNPAFYNAQSFVVTAGTSGVTTINTVVSGGFNSPIALAGVDLPSGITANFSPDTITGNGSSQATIAVGLGVAPGTYSLTMGGTSQGVTETASSSLTVAPAPPANFTLGISPSAFIVNAGSQATATLTIAPEYGFNSTVSFACSGLPSGATCSFSPATVTPSGGATSTQVTISTSAQMTSLRSNSGPASPVAVLAVLFCLGWRKRRGHQLLLLIATCTGLVLVAGCGGGSSGGGGSTRTPVTSSMTISATAGTLQQTAKISLTVN